MSEQISFEIQKVAYNTAFVWLKKKYHKEDNELYIYRNFTDGTFTMVVSNIRFGNKTLKDLRYEFKIDNVNKAITIVSKVLAYSVSGQTVKSYNDTHDVDKSIPFIYDYDTNSYNTLSTSIMNQIENHIRDYIKDDLKDYDTTIRIVSSNSDNSTATYFVRATYTDENSLIVVVPIQYEFNYNYNVSDSNITCTKISKFVVDSMYIHTVRQ